MAKWVYSFGDGDTQGRAGMGDLLGGKGANLAEMSRLGLPVPPGFTLTTEACLYATAHDGAYPPGLDDEVTAALARLEAQTGSKFGDAANPLLVSVRSGARVSMPGMMDTVLNLGLNDETVKGLAARSGDARFADDSYRRFIHMYADVVMDVDHDEFEECLERYKETQGLDLDTEMAADDWREIVRQYKELVQRSVGDSFPADPHAQLWGAIGAVFRSWMNERAQTYRRLHNIPGDWGTAVNIQAMVFGNLGEDCATGVAFTRDPATGANAFYGEFLVNAQGEDVVAGTRTPQHLTIAAKDANHADLPAMEEVMPAVFAELCDVRLRLETHFKDMQDIEFTVQQGHLYMLQTRDGKRTTGAAVNIAVDMANEGLISRTDAIERIDPAALDQLLHPRLDPQAPRTVLARGLPASPGAASGRIVFSADEARDRAAAGERVVLVRIETSPEDIHGMHAAQGILTARGGMTSHAAVVARGMGRPCVAGAVGLRVDYGAATLSSASVTLHAGDVLTIDGGSGEVMEGEVSTIQPELSASFVTLMQWADGERRLGVRTNADTPEDCRAAVQFGAEGIGLCRTEHMFFDPERILAIRKMIMADDAAGRDAALSELLPFQRADFAAIFRIMGGLPVTIRLLDPPLHEFLPNTDAEIDQFAAAAGADPQAARQRTESLRETNPMLGHRGCRLGLSFPEIYDMQARAVFEAAAEVTRDSGEPVVPEIMIPLAATAREVEILKRRIDAVAHAVNAETGTAVDYLVGTMIELPRAALRAGELARWAQFFSFGTNDLTQTTWGISRDDAGSFLPDYDRLGIIDADPFVSLDIDGVGELVRLAAERGRAARADLKLGICGEHGGDPASIAFFEAAGLDYVSCSPYRVPIARLAAAQAAIRRGRENV